MSNTHQIVLTDGTKITAELNGNNYITNESVEESQFTDLSGMTIDGEKVPDAVLRNLWGAEDGTHIVFGTMTETEKAEIRIADLEEMIADIAGGAQ
jgi:hypothetical protein